MREAMKGFGDEIPKRVWAAAQRIPYDIILRIQEAGLKCPAFSVIIMRLNQYVFLIKGADC